MVAENPDLPWYTAVCGWHEHGVFQVQSGDPKTALFKCQCAAWKAAYESDPQSMAGVDPANVDIVAFFAGRLENLYPFLEMP